MSTSSIIPPALVTATLVAKNVFDGIKTFLFFTLIALRANSIAVVPLEQDNANLELLISLNLSSNSLVYFDSPKGLFEDRISQDPNKNFILDLRPNFNLKIGMLNVFIKNSFLFLKVPRQPLHFQEHLLLLLIQRQQSSFSLN